MSFIVGSLLVNYWSENAYLWQEKDEEEEKSWSIFTGSLQILICLHCNVAL